MSLMLIVICYLFYGTNTSAITPVITHVTCPQTSLERFAPNSTYQKNLELLFSTLISKATIQNGFYNFTAGLQASSDRVYGLFLCRGDVPPDACSDCVSTARQCITSRCRATEAVIWYEECMLRYSYIDIFSRLGNEDPIQIFSNSSSRIQNSTLLMQTLNATLTEISDKAANDISGKKYATAVVSFESGVPLYCLVQCTPDLSVDDCNKCLRISIAKIPSGKNGVKMLSPSCYLRYEMYPFYEDTGTISPSIMPLSAAKGMSKNRRSKVIIGIIALLVGFTSALLLAIISIYMLRRKPKKQEQSAHVESDGTDLAIEESLQYDLVTLEAATNGFSDKNKIGEGGSGVVYKGLLSDGKEIAIKRLFKGFGQDAKEFKNEVDMVARLQHRNLVRLLGFCLDGDEKLLVYEFVPNKSLDDFLFDSEQQARLNWSQRYNIIVGIVRGMLYLHEESRLKIIHRDLKASNILLDMNMNPKISDFGTARIFGGDQTHESTNRPAGTYGYMAPEYVIHGQYSEKSDVYSFGVLVLEIISGKRKTNFYQPGLSEDLLSHAWKLWRDGTPLEFVDTGLQGSFSIDEVMRCIHLGLLCVQENVELRPNMASIVLMLYMCSISTLAMPQLPPFSGLTAKDQWLTVTKDKQGVDQSTIQSMPWSVNKKPIHKTYPS